MTDTALFLSPALVRLIRCLSGGTAVAFEILSPDLAPLLPPSDDVTAAMLRQSIVIGQDDAVRTMLAGATDRESKQRIRTPSLLIDLRPIRDGLRTVALLAAATQAGSDTARAERHMDQAGDAIQQLLEGNVRAARAGSAHERRNAGWLRLLGHLPGLADEAELLDFFLQALAVWHDLDTRVYVHDVARRFVLAARLPGDRAEAPDELPAELGERARPARISSVAELERLGWFGPPHELTLVPLGPANEATHIVAVRGVVDAELEVAILSGCRILGVCLDAALARDERRIQDRFSGRLREVGGTASPGLATLAQQLMDDLARWVGAEHAVFSAGELALQGRASTVAGAPGHPAGRFLVPLNLPGAPRAVEFSTASAVPFTNRHVRLATAGTRLLEIWLLGLNQAIQVLERDRQARMTGTERGRDAL